MEEFRIRCKVNDASGRLAKVAIGVDQFTVEQIWNWIATNKYAFYTEENGIKAPVKHVQKGRRKYITTAPDGITENNLAELQICKVNMGSR
ncbi:Protein of unknown function (DUF3892) [Candidatus Nitrososphaera evergladensis SR1]|jgi:response regulator of citrate/malate metabolism|uniref:DUF3892 domain-containing protein n=1 Tax=Candidatus Nitrososphaera evergladensis SR1 TaxID=1459636 RepID=A0A075MMX8_9ARCH|nr:DUF3892 domain-containing protein [Candidatus Nitrososphaera evergladensis]AIF82623.1 Protein of unknown function (DUF3892) [Candidatus Nitrososphaera evergladensis SR1]